MRIEELNPKVTTTVTFSIDCPICRKHRVSVNISPSPNGWEWDGKTLTPSIQFEGGFPDKTAPGHQTIMCKGHFTITGGEVNLC